MTSKPPTHEELSLAAQNLLERFSEHLKPDVKRALREVVAKGLGSENDRIALVGLADSTSKYSALHMLVFGAEYVDSDGNLRNSFGRLTDKIKRMQAKALAFDQLGEEHGRHTLKLSEEQRQLVLMALAILSIARPGWDFALHAIATQIDELEKEASREGQDRRMRAEMYDQFRSLFEADRAGGRLSIAVRDDKPGKSSR